MSTVDLNGTRVKAASKLEISLVAASNSRYSAILAGSFKSGTAESVLIMTGDSL